MSQVDPLAPFAVGFDPEVVEKIERQARRRAEWMRDPGAALSYAMDVIDSLVAHGALGVLGREVRLKAGRNARRWVDLQLGFVAHYSVVREQRTLYVEAITFDGEQSLEG